MRHRYGDAWEKFPIRRGEVWVEVGTGSKVAVWDLFDGLPGFMLEADLVYTDPPWNTGNMRSFYTKAGMITLATFVGFTRILFDRISAIAASACYLEIGGQELGVFKSCMALIYPVVQVWPVTYYRKNPSWLLRGGQDGIEVDFAGADDMNTPQLAMEAEEFSCVADLCMGRGLTAVTAHRLGKRFVGTELNQRRLACAIEKVAKKGGVWNITRR